MTAPAPLNYAVKSSMPRCVSRLAIVALCVALFNGPFALLSLKACSALFTHPEDFPAINIRFIAFFSPAIFTVLLGLFAVGRVAISGGARRGIPLGVSACIIGPASAIGLLLYFAPHC